MHEHPHQAVRKLKQNNARGRKLFWLSSVGDRELANKSLKPGLHEPQLPVERSVTLLSSIEIERRRCALLVSRVARLQENKET